jgi:hypothetical protein
MNMKEKSLFGILLSLALMFVMMPALGLSMPAYAEDPVSYDLWVGGTQVTSANAGDVFGNNKVSYDAAAGTLTLNAYSYKDKGYTYDSKCAAIYAGSDLKVVLTDKNTLENTYAGSGKYVYGIYSKGNLNITGTGELSVTGGSGTDGFGIYADGNVVIDDGKTTATAEGGSAVYSEKDVIINNGEVTATGGEYGICGENSVKISGGIVNAVAESDSRHCYGIYSSSENVMISGGRVTASAAAASDKDSSGILSYSGNVSISGGKSIKNAQLMGIHTKDFGETAWFKESLLPYHYHEYLNAISQDPSAILVSSNFRDLYDYEVGDVLHYTSSEYGSSRGVIYGFVDYWPGYAPVTVTKGSDGLYKETPNFLVVAHLAHLQSTWGVTPYQVWIDAEDSTQFIYDHAAQTETKYAYFQDAAAQLLDMKNDPIFQGTNGILTIGFVCILLLCSIGFLIYWILSIQSRTLQFGIFRAMGMTMREIFTMLINEQIFITGVSIGVGVLVGVLTSKLFVPLIQIAYSSADQVIPIEIVSESSDYVRLFAVIGVVILICMAILGVLISKIKISQALKLGED